MLRKWLKIFQNPLIKIGILKKNLINSNFFLIRLPSLLLVILPLLLITGPFLSDLAITISALIFILNSYYNNLTKYYKSYFFFLFCFFFLIICISSILSENFSQSYSTSFFYLRFGIYSLSVWYLISVNPKILENLLFMFVFCFCLLLFDGYFQYFSGKNIFGYPIIGTRVSSFFQDKLILGSYLVRLFPLFFGLSILYYEKKKIDLLF